MPGGARGTVVRVEGGMVVGESGGGAGGGAVGGGGRSGGGVDRSRQGRPDGPARQSGLGGRGRRFRSTALYAAARLPAERRSSFSAAAYRAIVRPRTNLHPGCGVDFLRRA